MKNTCLATATYDASTTALCICMLLLSVSLALLVFVNWIVSLCKRNNGFLSPKKRQHILSAFHLMVVGIFFSIEFLYIPIFRYSLDGSTFGIWVKTIFLSLQNSLQLFVVNADFGNVKETIAALGMAGTLKDVYTVYISIYFVAAPLLTAVFILSLIKGLYEQLRYLFRSTITKLYIFSELNDESLALATSIADDFKNRDEDVYTKAEKACEKELSSSVTEADFTEEDKAQKPLRKVSRTIIFANVTSALQEERHELVEAAHKLGAICLDKDISQIGLKPHRKQIYRRLYLIGLNENDNVNKAITLIKKCCDADPIGPLDKKRNCDVYNCENTSVYVFAVSDESGLVLDAFVDGQRKRLSELLPDVTEPFRIKVRRVDEARNFVWRVLLESREQLQNPDLTGSVSDKSVWGNEMPYIFDSAIYDPEDKLRHINVLIVGLGIYGTEFLRNLCWFCQMPGYKLSVHVLDGKERCESKIRAIAPEIVEKNNLCDTCRSNEATYNLHFVNNAVDVNSAAFADNILKIKETITLAIVALGDDSTNIDTAIKIRRLLGRDIAVRFAKECKNIRKGFPNNMSKEEENAYKALVAKKERELADQAPFILTAVYNSDKAHSLCMGKSLNINNIDYKIRFIGDTSSRFTLPNIEQVRLERLGKAINMLYTYDTIAEAQSKEKTSDTSAAIDNYRIDWNKAKWTYELNEYSRLSSKAQGLHLIARRTLTDQLTNRFAQQDIDELFVINEHKRWNAYLRSVGYVYAEGKDNFAKVHRLLVPCENIDEDEKKKDRRDWNKVVELVQNMEEQMIASAQKSSAATLENKGRKQKQKRRKKF